MTCRALYARYYSILAAAPERQPGGRDHRAATGMVCNLFDNHIRLDYTGVASTYILPIMALVYCRT
jgi:hypothetical protein